MEFTYTGIRVWDLMRSLKVYTETMELQETERGTMNDGGLYLQLKSPNSDQKLELNYYPPGKKYYEEYAEGSELDHLAFRCQDVRACYKRLLDGGAVSAIEPWDEGNSTLAFVRDPDGVWIELIGKREIRQKAQ